MPPVLKFLRLPGSSSENELQIIDKSVQFAQTNRIDVEIISDAEEVKNLIADSAVVDQSIYVCFPFEGKIFEKIKEKGYRIIGPQCVLSCLLLEMPVPKEIYPINNVCMLNTVICCSSMKKDERLSIHQLVLMMGGKVTGDFTSAVSHLIAKEVGSMKYKVACSNKVPVLFPSWVQSSWEYSKFNHLVATEDSVMKEHLIPIFKGCTICVTGIDATKRESIKTITNKNGGVYSGELNMKTCTHLLVEHPSGQKYAHARQWKLHCVSPNWLYDCLKKKHWVDEKPYIIEPNIDTTVHNSTLQQSNIQNTFISVNNSRLSSKPAELAAKSKNNSDRTLESEAANKNNALKFKVILSHSINISDVKIHESGSYLEECKIFVCNRPGPIYDACKKIINNGGGIRFDVLTDSITHVVAWDQIQPDVSMFINELKKCEGMLPHVVSPLWLFDSCKNGKILLEEDYSLIEDSGIDEHTISDDDVFAKPKLPAAKPSVASSLQINFEDEITDDGALLNQYLTVKHESTRISQFDILDINKGRPNLEDVTQEGTETTFALDEEEPTINLILMNKLFVIHRFEEHNSQIKSLIEEYGGEVVDDDKEFDYIIVPLSYEHEISIDKKEVTLCWLEQSIEQQELKDPKSSCIFQPICIPSNVRPLQNCVITISQYSGIERQHLFHLAELLGGIGQEFFVRNDTSNMKASTHLILSKPEGSKYDASIKWGIPCVDKDWLFRCAQTKRRLPESGFSMCIKKEVEEVVTNIEETNVHAWEKPQEVCTVVDKPITACPPNAYNGNVNDHNATDHISLDFSTRGASLMDAIEKKDTIEICKEDITIPLMETSDKTITLPNISDDEVIPLEKKNEQENTIGALSTVGEMDFSKFNAFIANEKKEAFEDTVKCNMNKENLNTNSTLPSTVPRDFNKSRFSFDFSEALNCFQSPISQDSRRQSSSRKSRGSLPFDLQFQEALEKAVDKLPHIEQKIWDDIVSKNKETSADAILQGVVVVVSKKLSQSQSELNQLVTILGGDIRFMYDDSCTHFIHQGKINDTSKDYLEAKKNKKYLVSPHWLQACLDANMKVNEDIYPVTYNPRLSIEVISERPNRNKTQVKSSSTEGSSNDETDVFGGERKEEEESVKSCSPKEKLDFQKKMEEIMNAAKAPRNERRQTRRQTNTSSVMKGESGCNRKMRNRTSSQQKNDSGQSNNSNPQIDKPLGIDFANEQSQGGFITYDDPTGRLERERILEHLKRASPSQDIESLYYPVENLICPIKDNQENEDLENHLPSFNLTGNAIVMDNINNGNAENEPKKSLSPYRPQISLPITNESPKPEVIDLLYDEEAAVQEKKLDNAKKYKFLFSGMTAQEKIDYGATIEELGGTLFDVQYFNMQCTHLVVNVPSRNEKYLSSLACGRWALHKSYLDASREANDFVDELDHEWGSQTSANELASAARRWRIELSEKRSLDPKVGAFTGWTVLLCIEPSKQPGLKRILEAGGAKLLALRPPFDNVQGATHAFIGDKKLVIKAEVDLKVLHDAGIWILKPEYISDYLTVDPKPPTFHYVLDEVNSFNEQPESVPTQKKRKAAETSRVKQKRTRR